jgi:Ni,Fe-hydrogenase maturation factor
LGLHQLIKKILAPARRIFFYSNEGNYPIHVHAEKGNMECKFWILVEEVEIREAFSYNLSPSAKKEIKKIIFLAGANVSFVPLYKTP